MPLAFINRNQRGVNQNAVGVGCKFVELAIILRRSL